MHRRHPSDGAARAAALAFLSLGVLLSVPAYAADEDSTPRVVVSASRLEQPAGQVGSAVTVITEEEIERHQDRHVVDALKRVPGVSVRRDGNRPGARSSIFIRGASLGITMVAGTSSSCAAAATPWA